MKKILLPLLLLSVGAQAQITITSADNSQIGDTSVTYGYNNKKLSPGNAGANQTWDFSTLVPVSAVFSSVWTPNSSTPGFSEFPNANMVTNGITLGKNGQLIPDSTFGYNLSTSTYSDLLGTYNGDKNNYVLKIKYSKPHRILKFPFAYQEVMTYDAQARQDIGSIDAPRLRQINGTVTYDAYGKVIFPGTSALVDAARLKKVEIVKDSSVMDLGEGFVSKTYTESQFTQYTYFTKEKKGLTILYTKLTVKSSFEGEFPIPPTIQVTQDTSVIYTKPASKQVIVSSLEGDFENAGVYKVFPSVTSGKISLSDPSKVTSVSIFNLKGEEQTVSQDFNTLAIEGQAGVYIVKVAYSNGKQKAYKIIKQ